MFPKVISFNLLKDPSVIKNYNKEDLDVLKKVYSQENPLTIYDFAFNPKSYMEMEEKDKKILKDIVKKLSKDFPKYFFLDSFNKYFFIKSIIRKKVKKIKLKLKQKEEEFEEFKKNKEEILIKYHSMIRQIQLDFEKYKTRVESDKKILMVNANEKLVTNLLPVLDGFVNALEMASDDFKKDPFYQGVVLIQKQFDRFLDQQGISKVDSIGKLFDPNLHEAMQIYKTKKKESDGRVIEEWQKGYTLNGKLIRPSKVVVAELEK